MGHTIEAVIYGNDPPEAYPDWFVTDILEGQGHMDAYGNFILLIMSEPEDTYKQFTLVPQQSVVMRNRYGDLHFTDIETFDREYFEMGRHYAAFKTDCVEFFIFREGDSHWPVWFLPLISKGLVVIGAGVKDCVFHYRGTPILLPKTGVFLRNWQGVVKFISLDEFNTNYESPYPDYYTEVEYSERSDDIWRKK